MRRRAHHAVLIAVLALQALVAPALFASSGVALSTAASSGCPDQMSQSDEPCPCCPDGVMVAGCMSLCTAFSAGFGVAMPAVLRVPGVPIPFALPSISTQTYAPLNPPPIL